MTRNKRPTPVTTALVRKWALPRLDGRLGKEARGQVMVVGGSDEIPGAVMLAAIAARAGAGKLLIATSKHSAPYVAVAVPEARVVGLRFHPQESSQRGARDHSSATCSGARASCSARA